MRRPGAGAILRLTVLILLAAVSLAALAMLRPGATPGAVDPSAVPSLPGEAVLVGAGDIVECDEEHDEATAALVEAIEGTVFTTGDNAYPDGTEADFRCYDASWGRFKDRTRPSAGNHDYSTPGAAPYYAYFGEAAGRAGEGWYSYDLGAWHVVVLNSNCGDVDCSEGSPQLAWLRADLEASQARCTVAIWHHARWGSGRYGDNDMTARFWQVLYDAGAELALVGHEHFYERFAPQDPEQQRDEQRGIRQIIVGTGGGSLREFEQLMPNSEVRLNERFGVLKLTLSPDRYRWDFITAPDGAVEDSGVSACH